MNLRSGGAVEQADTVAKHTAVKDRRAPPAGAMATAVRRKQSTEVGTLAEVDAGELAEEVAPVGRRNRR